MTEKNAASGEQASQDIKGEKVIISLCAAHTRTRTSTTLRLPLVTQRDDTPAHAGTAGTPTPGRAINTRLARGRFITLVTRTRYCLRALTTGYYARTPYHFFLFNGGYAFCDHLPARTTHRFGARRLNVTGRWCTRLHICVRDPLNATGARSTRAHFAPITPFAVQPF